MCTHGHKEWNILALKIQKGGSHGRGIRVERLPNLYNVQYLSYAYIKSPDFTIMKHTHITNLHMYPLKKRVNRFPESLKLVFVDSNL